MACYSTVHFAGVFGGDRSLVAPPHDHVAQKPEEAEHEHDQDSDCQDDHVAASSCGMSALPFSVMLT